MTGRELKFSAETGEITGYGAAFGNTDSYGDVIVKGAFNWTLGQHKAAGTAPLMLWGHDDSKVPIGAWTEMREDDYGLHVKGKLNLDIAAAREVASALATSKLGLSIGFRAKDYSWRTKPDEPRRTLKAVDLHEISVVNFPANSRARVNSIKSNPTLASVVDRAIEEIKNHART